MTNKPDLTAIETIIAEVELAIGKLSAMNGNEIQAVAKSLPSSVMADMNGDGMPDAYWDNH